VTLLRLLRQRRYVSLAVVTTALAAHTAMWLGVLPCPLMSMTGCLRDAALLVGAGSLAALTARAGWIARTTRRAVAAIPTTVLPPRVLTAAAGIGITRVVGVAGTTVTAFCAGLLRPRVYLTETAANHLSDPELAAVLAHEAAHARRHDPLRQLLLRAALDTLFYLPLLGWWSSQQRQHNELAADRAAIAHTGTGPVASAILATAPPAGAATITGFHGDTDARIAQLSGEAITSPRPPLTATLASLTGTVLALSLAMCLTPILRG
jgi:Zn-dependent protease with chaperone function